MISVNIEPGAVVPASTGYLAFVIGTIIVVSLNALLVYFLPEPWKRVAAWACGVAQGILLAHYWPFK